MRHFIPAATWLLAVLVLLSISCQKNPLDPPADTHDKETPIEFGVADNWTKAVIPSGSEGLSVLQNDKNGIKVWSWFQGTVSGPYFEEAGTQVTYTNNVWDYSPERYWISGTYHFASVYPSSLSGTYAPETSGVSPSLNVTDFDISSQDDVLVAFNTGVDGQNHPASVELKFKHALSNIQLQLTLDKDSFFVDEDGDGTKEKQVGRAYATIVGFNNIATVADLVATSSEEITWEPASVDGQLKLYYTQNPEEVTDLYKNFFGTDGLLVVPQQLGTGNAELYIQVAIYPFGNDDEKTTKEFKLPLASGGVNEWEPNTKYVYQVGVTQDMVIDFSVIKVNDWKEGEPLGGFIVS